MSRFPPFFAASSSLGGAFSPASAGFFLLLLGGCAQLEPLATQIPTARYCHEVHYDRVHNDVAFSAKCTAPFGGM
jgi:hypothetical protein